MKKLSVTITLELEIPEDWELVKTSEGTDVLKIGDEQYLDLTFEPMLANDPEGTWTDSANDELVNDLLDMVESEDVAYTVTSVH